MGIRLEADMKKVDVLGVMRKAINSNEAMISRCRGEGNSLGYMAYTEVNRLLWSVWRELLVLPTGPAIPRYKRLAR